MSEPGTSVSVPTIVHSSPVLRSNCNPFSQLKWCSTDQSQVALFAVRYTSLRVLEEQGQDLG